MSKFIMTRRGLIKAGAVSGVALAAPMHFVRNAFARGHVLQHADRRHRDLRLQRAADRRLCRRGRRRTPGLPARRQAPQRRGRRRHAQDDEADGPQGQRHPRQEGRLRHRRHPDQVRRRARLRQAHDREGRRDHDLRRLVVGRRGRRAVPVPGDGHHLHGRPDALQRHHRQGQEALRLPPLLQRLPVGRRARLRCSPRNTARTARPIT